MAAKRTKKKPIRHSKKVGKNAYIDSQKGVALTRKEAILAKCYECMGEYDSGKMDCCGLSCPLYQYYPYKRRIK